MKTKFFKNGFGAKLMLAALALAGTMFTSCEEDELNTVFNPGPATVDITASVYDPVNMADVTLSATVNGAGRLTFADGVKEGTKVTVSASYNGQSAQQEVLLNKLAKGGYATYHVNLVLNGVRPTPDPVDNGLVLVEVASASTTATAYSTPNAQSHAVMHEGSVWFENATEFFYPWTVTFNANDNVTCTSKSLSGLSADDKKAYEALIGTMESTHEATGEVSWKAAAWSLSRAVVEYTTVVTTYEIQGDKTGKVFGSFELTEKYAATSASVEEIAHPNHASHFVPGHASHDHGHGGQNAGGGIVVAD